MPDTRRASSPWLHDRPPHLPCRRGELPARVLFPGDPGRVDRCAAVLDEFHILGQNREFRIGVGSFRGTPIGVCSTGIGGPSTEIALIESAALGCRIALRVGGTGALQPQIPLGSLLIVNEAARTGGAAAHYAPLREPALASPALIVALVTAAQVANTPHQLAKVASTDGYYAAQGRAYPNAPASFDGAAVLNEYRQQGVAALDMEAETMLTLGHALGLQAGALLAVHANRATDAWLEAFEPAQLTMLRVACQAVLAIEDEPALRSAYC
jgi:uridine phosphorylase